MRSRYTAYTQADMDYIARTMRGAASEHFDAESAHKWAKRSRWIKLEVLHASMDGQKGFVEFRAHYSLANKLYVLHEISEFHLDQGEWYYIDGQTPPVDSAKKTISAGRNEPCPCGSGKKFKKCCGK
ncbi:hypothetical protein AQUSIP_22440 [Aquicella siphonis]|uniref:YchJ-like middle NTF2-like domain-containing protein n=2 Tax=Aquicella siphonis TaxID=254247 RepID=A0A5E4PKI0_9COXI|nr:hypothetical protein AQUSIP_22440 [Aquicella siphonis]